MARSLAARLAGEDPECVTDRRDRAVRRGRVLIDCMPNAPRALTVAPYSLRATDRPAVSTPVEWAEVERAARAEGDEGLRFGPVEVLERAEAIGDAFRGVLERDGRLLPG